MAKKKPVIEFRNLTFSYQLQEIPALKNINLTIYEGEYVAILGLNGAGKTTLQLCINGVIPNMIFGDFEGDVLVNGLNTQEYPTREMAKIVGMVFDNPEFQLTQTSVAEEVALGLENLGIPTVEMHPIIEDALETVGLDGLQERSPFALSGGQQQRLAIASALAMKPQIFVMDEPTSNIDPIGKEEVIAVAAKLNKEKHMTVILAEHEVEVIAQFADHVIVIHEGEIILDGTPHEVFAQVEKLEKIGLRVPQVTEFAYRLEKEYGVKVKEYPIKIDEAEQFAADTFKK
ncbi:MAG: ATP-binding cassette domain-containing protein [Pelolinea sp.]|nr:ATP-binding cassette domain-containing protein [Pelolinea sp.]